MRYTRKSWLILLAVALLLGLAWFDKATGVEFRVGSLYLIPVVMLAWHASLGWAVLASILASGFFLMVGLNVGRFGHSPFFFYLEALGVLASLLIGALLAARLRQTQERLSELARHDSLTGISNRTAFSERLELEIARHRRLHAPMALIFLDCDDFKKINDSGGHLEGDRLLRIVAVALQGTVRQTDLVCRLAGDEFVVLLPQTDLEGAKKVAEMLHEQLHIETMMENWKVTFSTGVAIFLKPPHTPEQALKEADRLMYEAKQTGKGHSVYRMFGTAAK